jgi:hypothetical protein
MLMPLPPLPYSNVRETLPSLGCSFKERFKEVPILYSHNAATSKGARGNTAFTSAGLISQVILDVETTLTGEVTPLSILRGLT